MEHHPILSEIAAFIEANPMAESTFGRKAAGDWRLIQELSGTPERGPRWLRPRTEERIRKFMSQRAA